MDGARPWRGRGGAGEGRRRGQRGNLYPTLEKFGPAGGGAGGWLAGDEAWKGLEGGGGDSRSGETLPPSRQPRGVRVTDWTVSGGECWGFRGPGGPLGGRECGFLGNSGRCLQWGLCGHLL